MKDVRTEWKYGSKARVIKIYAVYIAVGLMVGAVIGLVIGVCIRFI